MNKLTEYRRRLPHFHNENAVFFITFRLKGTLPAAFVKELKDVLEFNEYTRIAKQDYYEAIDEYLDQENCGPIWLAQSEVADLIASSLKFYDNSRYKLICYCIMSNHVHFIGYDFKIALNQFMKNLKTYTATQANKMLNRKGAFWQREYYDRVIRDRNDLDIKIKYVLNNPVKAGLVEHWKEWKYSYCNNKFLDELFLNE